MKFRWTRSAIILCFALLISFVTPFVYVHAVEDLEDDRNAVYYYLKFYHINGENVVLQSIDDMIASVDDPYTQYFTAEQYTAFINQIDGTLVGVGIHLEEKEGAVVVVAPVKGSPAEQVGILPGDKIVAVDGESVIGKSLNEITSKVRGEEGTMVQLTVQRGDETITYAITRAKIELPLVEYEVLTEEGIGYIYISSFGDHTITELETVLTQLKDMGIENIILDVRGNPGGKVDSVMEVASLFIGDGPIMWVKNGWQEESSYDTYGELWWDQPLVLLTDQGSASASEILAAALQDYHIGIVMGEKTFGKGTMQSIVPLPSGNVLKLTTNEFFSPRKNTIRDVGITPDITVLKEEDPIAYAKNWLINASHIRNGETGQLVIEKERIQDINQWVLMKDDQPYVALYRLHGMLGGELYWNQQTRTATYKINDVTMTFTMDRDPMIVRNGRIYAPLESLYALPNLNAYIDQEGNFVLERK